MKKKEEHWDDMYKKPLEEIPWEIPEPPKELVSFLEDYEISRKSALDVGCGSGNYSLYLAKRGFKVTGVDFAQSALKIARERAGEMNLDVKFVYTDVLDLLSTLDGKKYDFIFDYSLLHHIAPEDINKYTNQFPNLLNESGYLMLICYSDKDYPSEVKTGDYGNDMYYRTRAVIEKLYCDLKLVSYAEGRLGKRNQHYSHIFVFKK